MALKWRARRDENKKSKSKKFGARFAIVGFFAFAAIIGFSYAAEYSNVFTTRYDRALQPHVDPPQWPLPLDTVAYNAKLLFLAHAPTTTPLVSLAAVSSTTPKSAALYSATTSASIRGALWPHPAAYPEGNAVLPFRRVVAYYGNFYSKQMGVLGEYPEDEVMAKLASTSAAWERADPSTPAIPAIQYIAVVAQGSAGKDGLYRLRMPDDQIDKALDMANRLHGLLFLDIQVGKSTLASELPEFAKYFSLPNVELGIDPEFSMKYGNRPGTVIGTFDAKDANYAAGFLANIVREKRLPPKILVVHRFTEDMVTHAAGIRPLPEVEVVMDMDGWGSTAKKIGTYTGVVAPEPVQFTGMKLFYKNDLKPPSTGMLSMEEILKLTPAPVYIQYQ